MSDTIKQDETKAATELKSIESTATSDVATAEGWVESHWVWIAGLAGVVLGFVIAHFTHW